MDYKTTKLTELTEEYKKQIIAGKLSRKDTENELITTIKDRIGKLPSRFNEYHSWETYGINQIENRQAVVFNTEDLKYILENPRLRIWASQTLDFFKWLLSRHEQILAKEKTPVQLSLF